jgi:CheY-like chemotaxis protein/HPt (histidine-containing phosphotransfer) domain-containing protein
VRRRSGDAAAPAAAASGEQRLAGLRILVVDDSDINREVAKRILGADGAAVELAENGQQAIEWLAAHAGSVDIVLMDVQMPVMDGYEATRMIRSSPDLARLPVIALTAGAFKTQLEAARAAGMDDFVAKPFDVDALMQVIRRLTGKKPQRSADDAEAAKDDRDPHVAVDFERGLALWRDRAVYLKYLRRFVEEYADLPATLTAQIVAGDVDTAAARAHKLKGASGSLALLGVMHAAERLETQLKSGADIDLALHALLSAFAAAGQQIETLVRDEPAEVRPVQRDDADDEQLIDALLVALDSDAPDLIEPALAKLRDRLPREQFDVLQALIDQFDFRRAEALLRGVRDARSPVQ